MRNKCRYGSIKPSPPQPLPEEEGQLHSGVIASGVQHSAAISMARMCHSLFSFVLQQKKQKCKPHYFPLEIYVSIFASRPKPLALRARLVGRSPSPDAQILP